MCKYYSPDIQPLLLSSPSLPPPPLSPLRITYYYYYYYLSVCACKYDFFYLWSNLATV